MPPVVAGLVAVGAAVGGAGVGVGIGAAVLGASVIATGIGTVLSVVGMVTKNKLISQIGMGFGIAGAVGGLGATAAVNGVFGASMQASSLAPLQASTATTSLTSTIGTAATQAPTLGGGSTLAGTVGGQSNVPQGVLNAATPSVRGAVASPLLPVSPVTAPSATSVAPSVASNSLMPVAPLTGTQQFAAVGAPSIGAPTSLTTGLQPFSTSLSATKSLFDATPAAGFAQIFANLEPAAKSALLMAGGQAVAGGVGGIFTGMSADKQMALQQLIDQENRAQFTRQMERATSSPGLIQFVKPQTPMAPSVLNPSTPIAPTV